MGRRAALCLLVLVCACGPSTRNGDDDDIADMDNDGDGYTPMAGDCDDANASIFPGAAEVCDDGVDNDCNGNADSSD